MDFTFKRNISNRASSSSALGKRESIGGGNPVGNWPSSTGGLGRPLGSTVGGGAAGGGNMTPDDPAPDEEFALAIAQKSQVNRGRLSFDGTRLFALDRAE